MFIVCGLVFIGHHFVARLPFHSLKFTPNTGHPGKLLNQARSSVFDITTGSLVSPMATTVFCTRSLVSLRQLQESRNTMFSNTCSIKHLILHSHSVRIGIICLTDNIDFLLVATLSSHVICFSSWLFHLLVVLPNQGKGF